MKLLKKVISAVCAFGMITAVSSSMLVAQAEQLAPTLKIELLDYDEAAKTGQLKVSLLNLKGDTEENPDTLSISSLGVVMGFDSSEFDAEMYSNSGRVKPIDKNFVASEAIAASAQRVYNTDNENLGIAWASTPADGLNNLEDPDMFDNFEVATINFKLLGDSATITVGKPMETVVNRMSDDWSNDTVEKVYTYGNSNNSVADFVYDFPEIGGIEFVVPEAEGTEVSGDQILDVKPSDIGGTGDVFTTDDPDFEGEAAVASLANFAAMEGATQVEWKISATPVGGEATEYVKDFDLGATIDSATTIGIIVGYDTAEYSSVEVISGMLK